MVIKMKRIKPLKEGSLTGRIVRLLGLNKGFEEPYSNQEETIHVGILADNYHNYWKEIRTAFSEAERKKAMELMEIQKRRFIC